jgi:hypothetical protein
MAMTIRMTKPAAPAAEDVTQSDEPQMSTGPVLSAYAAPVKTESFAIAAIAGLGACIFFIALLLLQFSELSYYKQPPAAFPLSGPGIAVSPTTQTPAPVTPAPVTPAEATAPAAPAAS